MPSFTRAPLLRWLVPVVSAVVLLGGGWAFTQISAVAGTGLKPRSAAQLLVDVQHAHLDGLSGTIVQTADLGLPALPDTGGSGSANLSSLVTGTHTLKVWFSGPDHARVQLPGNATESDVILNGTDLWTWSSQTNTATHRTVQLPQHQTQPAVPQGTTPQALAKQALAAITPTTNVYTDGTAQVAGRPAYELVLQPKSGTSLIRSVQIGIDGATHVPTSFKVISRTGTTALDVSFTDFNPTRPGLAAFRFNPPAGAKVVQKKDIAPHSGMQLMPGTSPETSPGLPPGGAPHVVGHGWNTVVVADLGAKALGSLEQKAGPSAGMAGRLLGAMPPAPAGSCPPGHAFQGTVFSAVLTNDGRLAIGPVPVKDVCAALGKVGTAR